MIQTADNIWPEAAEALEAALAEPENEFLEIGRDLGRIESLDEIEYVVGQRWKQRFVVNTDEGFAFLRSQYYPLGEDGPGLYTYGAGRIYEDRCLGCHVTGLDMEAVNTLNRSGEDYTLEAMSAELGIGCEACHGPGSIHTQRPAEEGSILNPRDFSISEQNDFCGSCHGRNNGHVELEGREDPIGFQLGDNVRDYTKILSVVTGENVWRMVIDGETEGYYDSETDGSKRFYADGAGYSHRMAYNDLEQHPKFEQMSCFDCHNSHAANHLKAESFDALCAQCHDQTYDIDDIMPIRAMSSNTPDMRVHTFYPGGVGNPNDDVIPDAVPPSDID